MSTGPDQCEEYAAAQRAVARRLHPDLGGDTQEYLEAMSELEQQYAPPNESATVVPPTRVYVVPRRRVRAALSARTRAVVSSTRAALPRRWPGSRRYGRL